MFGGGRRPPFGSFFGGDDFFGNDPFARDPFRQVRVPVRSRCGSFDSRIIRHRMRYSTLASCRDRPHCFLVA